MLIAILVVVDIFIFLLIGWAIFDVEDSGFQARESASENALATAGLAGVRAQH